MKILVTQQDIDNGERHSCEACPIALAVARRLEAAPIVRTRYLYVNKQLITLSDEAREFIIAFDRDEQVKPFSFELDYKGA